MKRRIREIGMEAGAVAVGFAKAEEVDSRAWGQFCWWLDTGGNAGMGYMNNYPEIRRNPRLLLPDAETVISLAFPYTPLNARDNAKGVISSYALYRDYHKSLRKILQRALKREFPKQGDVKWRVCIDSAPIMERYWAVKSGVGFVGENGMLIVPGWGSRVLLVEIVMNVGLEPDSYLPVNCGHCGECRRACPGGAISDGGTIDCSRCINYLTIEHRGTWDELGTRVMETPEGRNTIFGCERCIDACLWNKGQSGRQIEGFEEVEFIREIGKDELEDMTEKEFNAKFADTALMRCGYEGIRRNLGI